MGFQPRLAQHFDGVEALRGRLRQPVLGVARLSMKRVASHKLFHAFIVTRQVSDNAAIKRPRGLRVASVFVVRPQRFVALWQNNPLTDRAGAQGHFDDLCELLGVDKLSDPDHYCFERGAGKAGRCDSTRPSGRTAFRKSSPATPNASSPNPATRPL
jgi:hypothetical protein